MEAHIFFIRTTRQEENSGLFLFYSGDTEYSSGGFMSGSRPISDVYSLLAEVTMFSRQPPAVDLPQPLSHGGPTYKMLSSAAILDFIYQYTRHPPYFTSPRRKLRVLAIEVASATHLYCTQSR